MQVYVAARVNDSVLLMAPLTCGDVPVQSAVIRSPCLARVTVSGMGLPNSMPSSSIQSVKLHSPSGSSASAARVRRSV